MIYYLYKYGLQFSFYALVCRCYAVGMVNVCCVPRCTNKSTLDTNVSYHRFPADKKQQRKWLRSIRRENLEVSQSTRVCSAHFRNGKKSSRNDVPYVRSPSPVPQPRQPRKLVIRTFSNSDVNVIENLENMNDDTSIRVDQENKADIHETLSDYGTKRHEHTKAESDYEDEYWPVPIQPMRLRHVYGNDKLIRFYTGLPNSTAFFILCDNLGMQLNDLQYWRRPRTFPDGQKRGPPRKLKPHDELLLTLVRLRLALLEEDLAFRFGICQSLVSQIIHTWISVSYNHLVLNMDWWISREANRKLVPKAFVEKYLYTRAIFDATEIFIQKPSDLSCHSTTWSSYKRHSTAKGLIVVAPFGGIMFASDLFTGSISDRELVVQSQVLDYIEEGDDMADRGFTISDLLEVKKATLNVPPFKNRKAQLSRQEIVSGRQIASLRIHVERAIGRMKHFRILSSVVPLKCSRSLSMTF